MERTFAGGAVRLQPDRIAEIRICRPEVRNALNAATLAGLVEAFRVAAADSRIRVLVVTGEGDEAFCAGADLREVASATDVSARRRYFSGVAEVLEAMAAAPQPVIAKVRGYALAGGMGLVCGADFAICAETAVLGLPEVNIGLFPMVVMAPILRAVGRRAAWELLTTGRRIRGDEAAALGLVNRSVPESELDEAVQDLAEELVRKSPVALAMGKAALYAVDGLGYRQALAVLREMIALTASSEDAREGVQAFFDKRPPDWPGR
ncbi:MAG: enoyl-CoA hydratase/isomerase family protein [Clostridia bacterium]|nr:enoyl-CoA hydratase/isomerase family protein [Clostridia bacterium]